MIDQYNGVNKNSEPVKYLARNIENKISCYALTRKPENTLKRRILKTYLITLIVPTLNK